MRHCCSLLGLLLLVAPASAGAQEAPLMPEDLQKTYGAYAASVLTFESSNRTSSHGAGGFACTQVLGFSQSMEWYAGLSVADHRDEGTHPDLSALEPGAFLPAWQGRFFMGAAVEEWRDPEYPGWSGHHRRVRETPVHCGRDEVDRVVFNVSGSARSADAWATAVDSVADVIRATFPAARRIVMQPVVGAEHVRRTLRGHYRPSTVRPERDRRAAVQDLYDWFLSHRRGEER